jgi:NhaP-type Na+/H+ and K+/H+ antiporter
VRAFSYLEISMIDGGGEQLQQAGSWLSRLAGPNGGYFWLVILALWGGTASYISRLKQNRGMAFSLAEWVGELTISGFAGLIMAYLCAEMHMSWYMTAVATAITGHMGGRALFMIEIFIRGRLGLNNNTNGGRND